MSESYPIFNEQTPSYEGYIDVREMPEWTDFMIAVSASQEAMEEYGDPADQFACGMAARHSDALSEQFGWEYNGQTSRVLGLAYGEAGNDESFIFDVETARFIRCDMIFLNGRWKAAFEFGYAQPDSDEEKSYHVPVDQHHILELRIKDIAGQDDARQAESDEPEEEERTPTQHIHEQAEQAKAQVFSEDFLGLAAEDQREILENMCDVASRDLPDEVLSSDAKVDCWVFYARHDDFKGIDLREFKVDYTVSQHAHVPLPSGVVEGYAYPELDFVGEERAFTAWDFTLGAGAPCLVVRNHSLKQTYFIPPHEIKDI